MIFVNLRHGSAKFSAQLSLCNSMSEDGIQFTFRRPPGGKSYWNWTHAKIKEDLSSIPKAKVETLCFPKL